MLTTRYVESIKENRTTSCIRYDERSVITSDARALKAINDENLLAWSGLTPNPAENQGR